MRALAGSRRSSLGSVALRCLLLALVLLAAACSSAGRFVWVQDLALPSSQPPAYVIAPGDLVDIRVYNEERLSSRGRVRSDGKMSLPLVGDVQVAGKMPSPLARELEAQLQKFLQSPAVTVQVDEVHAMSFTLVGEIARPGVFPLPPNTGVLQALALGGGLTEFADATRIYVLRRSEPLRIRFTYKQLLDNEPRATGFKLNDGDVITVE